MTVLRTVALLAVLGAPACRLGPRPARISAELSPAGARVVFPVGKRVLRGELITVQEGHLFLLEEGEDRGSPELVRIARGHVGSVRKFETPVGGLDETADAGRWERFRLASRHPQGLDAALLEQLLRSLGQERVGEVRP